VVHTDHADQAQVRRAYKFLLRPTSKQAGLLETALEDHRQLYNAALEERREAWRMRRAPISYCAQARQLPEIRHTDNCGQGRWSAGSQQQTLRRLDWAFVAFYRRVKAGKKPGYPRFKGTGRFNAVTWPAAKNGARWNSVPHPAVTRVYLLGIGHVRVHRHRPVRGIIKMICGPCRPGWAVGCRSRWTSPARLSPGPPNSGRPSPTWGRRSRPRPMTYTWRWR